MRLESDFTNIPEISQPESNALRRTMTWYYFIKRTIDVVVSSIALIIFFPLMLVIAVLIHFDSPGPVIFIQKRVGSKRQVINGQISWKREDFCFYKFRTMQHNADPLIHRAYINALINKDQASIHAIQNGDEKLKKIAHDKRITRVGRFLRRSSMDELPQFWNVLKGEMSLVGPRPAIPYEVEMYKPWFFQRFEAKPGLTGLWQVIARNSCDFDEMVELDIKYVKNQSLWLDLKIFLMTPLIVFTHKGV